MTSAKMQQLSTILELCEYVVMGRIVVDWAQPNDLITHNGWNNWRRHMCVLVSFAAMLTALFMVLITLKPNYAVVTHGFYVGIFPVVFATDFINGNCYMSCCLTKAQMGKSFCMISCSNHTFLYANRNIYTTHK